MLTVRNPQVTLPSGEKVEIELGPGATAADLRKRLCESHGFSEEKLYLRERTDWLDDHHSVSDCTGIQVFTSVC